MYDVREITQVGILVYFIFVGNIVIKFHNNIPFTLLLRVPFPRRRILHTFARRT